MTGAGSGIGRALAQRFAANGMHVVAADIEATALAETAARIPSTSARSSTDVSRVRRGRRARRPRVRDVRRRRRALQQRGRVRGRADVGATGVATSTWTLGVNLWGILHGIRAFVPADDRGRQRTGTSSTRCRWPACARTRSPGPYNVSKFAALAATECLAHDLAVDRRADRGVGASCPARSRRASASPAATAPASSRRTTTDDAAFVEQALADLTTGQGARPERGRGDDRRRDPHRTRSSCRPSRATRAQIRSALRRARCERALPPMPNFD